MATEDPSPLDLNAPEVVPAKKKKKTNKGGRILTSEDIEKRKNAEIDVIKVRAAEKEQYAAQRAKERELGIIEQARFKRINTALGRKTTPGEAQNFVVEKPLEPNALDEYQAKKIQQRDTIRNQKAFVPVQKL